MVDMTAKKDKNNYNTDKYKIGEELWVYLDLP